MKNLLLALLTFTLVSPRQFLEGQRAIIVADKTTANSSAAATIFGTLSNSSLVNIRLQQALSSLGTPTQLGTTWTVDVAGIISTKAAGPGTLTIALLNGATTVCSGVSPTLTTSLSNETITVHLVETVRTTGNTGTVVAAGWCEITNSTTGTAMRWKINTATAQTVAQDAAFTFDVKSTFSVADATNTVTWNTGGIQFLDSL